ncbi:hypothetical protein R11007_03318 [Ralstonia holmesii]|nr:hypothetical protein R11007_03318 [Ralstonia sp. LMG 32967]
MRQGRTTGACDRAIRECAFPGEGMFVPEPVTAVRAGEGRAPTRCIKRPPQPEAATCPDPLDGEVLRAQPAGNFQHGQHVIQVLPHGAHGAFRIVGSEGVDHRAVLGQDLGHAALQR